MITILHGDDISASRNEFVKLQKVLKPETIFDGETIKNTDILQVLGGNGLFVDNPPLFIEGLLSRKKASRELDELVMLLVQHEKESQIVLWEEKELTKAKLSPFKTARIQLFKIPQYIFEFLDNLT